MRRLRALLAPLAVVTPVGRAVLVLAVVGGVLGTRLHWAELTALAAVCAVALALAVPQLLRPRPARADLQLRPASTVAGTPGTALLTVGTGLLPLLSPVVSVTSSGVRTALRLPSLWRGREHVESFSLPAPRRGVYLVGPVEHEVADLLGLLRRRSTWAGQVEFLVRPRTILLDSLSTGVMSDLEGAPSAQLSASDLAFHALREYVPGDDLRHVHWRSSARIGGLLVRQYQETTRSHATVVLDDAPGSYASDDDFELAVSVAASVALRATLDDFEVTWVSGVAALTTSEPEVLLDHAGRLTTHPGDVAERARQAAATVAGTSLVAVVSGSRGDDAALRQAAAAFGAGPRRIVVRAEGAGTSRLEDAGDLRAVRVSRLEHLARLLDRDAG